MVVDIFTDSIVKGIIVSHSRTGITIQKIATEFYRCVGENWPLLNRSEEHVINYLEQTPGILSIVNDKNELLWYVRGKTLNGEKRGQIYRAGNQAKSHTDLSSNPHGNIPNTCNPYHNNNNNNNNKRRNSRSEHKVDRNNNGYGNANGHTDARNARQQRNGTAGRTRVNGFSSGTSINTDSANSIDSEQKTSASLYAFDLVGDDFFMELAKIDLGCSYSNRHRIHRCGLCISGQSIRNATDRLKRFPNADNMKIIVNLGSVDILNGSDLSDMCNDYLNLVKTCDRRHIQIIITTLAPLAHIMHCPADRHKLNQFNEFLMKRFPQKQVIDIASCVICQKTGKLLYDCYQPNAKYMSGSNKPHTLWNRIGRQRILKEIKNNLRF